MNSQRSILLAVAILQLFDSAFASDQNSSLTPAVSVQTPTPPARIVLSRPHPDPLGKIYPVEIKTGTDSCPLPNCSGLYLEFSEVKYKRAPEVEALGITVYSAAQVDERLGLVERQVDDILYDLLQKVAAIKPTNVAATNAADSQARIVRLEKTIGDLEDRLAKLEAASAQSKTSTATP